MRIVRTLVAAFVVCCTGTVPIGAQPGGPLGTAQLQISGARLTLYSDALTTDAEQTINVGEAARVRTCYGTGAACGAAAPGSVPGLKVVGDLSGPELPQAIPYETAPGGTFFLPGFQREGDYLLSNIRLVETATGRVLANAEPSLATLHVRQILLASAVVTRLTLADLQARGITLTQQNFKAFGFSVGFLFAGETVTIELPVLFQSGGAILPLDKQKVVLDGLPDSVRHLVQRWEPPRIIPFSLAGPAATPEDELDEEPIPDDTPLYGAIVIPGNVSFLNQFFDAKLIVANGAPNGSSATLQNVTGAMRLPTGDYLRLAATSPPVSVGQKLPVLKANGVGVIGPGDQGTVSWTVEGLVAGTQTLRMDIAAELARPGRVTLPLVGSAQAAVEVVDARFNLAFNHPDVVREGEAYSLYVTVTNLSRAAQNLVSVELLSENITGAHKADAAESFTKTIPTLDPGASETLEYRLVSDTTGKCVATTFQSSSAGLQGTIHLRTGVGELGIPLSPASLVLPRFSELLPRPLITADVRLLGLAYSLAVAPAGAAPAGLPHVIRSDVERRAVDLGEAGQRLYLQEKQLESLEALALDQLGNRHDLPEYDGLRRALDKGAAAASALGDLFRQEQANRNLTAADFVDHFANTMLYDRPWMSAALVPNGSQPAPTLEVRQASAAGTTYLAYTSEDPSHLRSLPYGEIYAIHDTPGGTKMPFALVGRLDATASYRVDLHAPATGASGRLVLVVPSDDLTGFRKVDFGFLTMAASEVWEVRAVKAAGDAALTFGLVYPTSGLPVPGAPPPSITNLTLPPFRLIGAVEDFTLDRYGLGVSYLFNRPPDKASAETASSYVIRSTFHGPDTSSPPVTFDKVETKTAGAAFWQPNSERVVDVRYASPVSALEGTADGLPVMRHDHLLATNAIRDTHGTPLDPAVPPALIESGHTGGLVDGVVRLGTGEPAAGATVQLVRYHNAQTVPGADPIIVADLVGEVTTAADGAFYFDFIEEPPQNAILTGFTLRASVPAGSDPAAQPGGTEQVSTTIRLLNRLVHVNIALLGRGTVAGKLVYADTGAPVPNGQVTAASTLFSEVKDIVVAADGSFTFNALPVGPITLSGRDDAGNRVYQTVGLQQPGQTVNVLLQLSRSSPPKTGTVIGRVLRQRSGSPRPPPDPSPGAAVAVYSNGNIIGQKTTDASGNFRFDKVPEGQIQVQAADFSVSRTPALAGAVLVADATVSLTLTISDAAPRVVTGRVLFHDGPTNTDLPVAGAVAFISGPGVFAYTDATGAYRIEGVPVQGASDPAYKVTAIDFSRQLQGVSDLPPILDVGDGSPIRAADIVLRGMTGGIDGIVLDPLGHPAGGVSVQIPHGPSASTGADGHFSLNDIGVGTATLVAHAGDGLLAGKIGWLGTGSATIVFAGHRPFATIRLIGSGIVNIHTKTATSTGVLSPIRYTPTVYLPNTFEIGPALLPVDTTTDADGRLQLVLPLPGTVVTAFSFLGNKSAPALLTYPGQVANLEIVFDSASAVTGHVVGVDGVTPVPNVDVFLAATGLLPQRQRTDGGGGFRYDAVPTGSVSVTTEALVGSVDRVGRADGRLAAGQTIDLTVVLRAQGTVKGRIVQLVGSDLVPIPFARFSVAESAYPNRRLPAGTATYAADASGAYEVSHLFAGPITVVGSDPAQPGRQGRATAEITADFQVLSMPDIVLTTSVGSLGVLVRDPATGSPVADCLVTLSNGDVTVSDALGQASFDALPLGTYSVYAFHAPTGQGGLVSGLRLQNAGDHVDATITLDTRGQISGTLWDDPAKTLGVGNGTVQLTGHVNGRLWGTSMTALASTSASPATLGQFLFDGIPVGNFTLVAAVPDSARRASTTLDLTATAPVAALDLVLEQLGDRYVRLFQNLKAAPHLFELDPSTGIFTVELTQPPGRCAPSCTYDSLLNAPTAPYPNHLYGFTGVYTSRALGVVVNEAGGEQRAGSISGLSSLPGAGTASDPFRVVLGAKGVVSILVRDGASNPAPGANVTLTSSGAFSGFSSTTDGTGRVTFNAIPAGNLTATAKLTSNGSGGLANGVLTYDDESVDLTVSLAPAVSAHGAVYHPPPGDIYSGDPASLVPEDKAIVQIRDSSNQLQVVQTGPDGKYRFDALKTGAYTISATNQTGESLASSGGTLAGPNGNDNALPDLILDASRPLIVSLTPPPGQTGVSRNAVVEIAFSEPLLASVLPAGSPTSPYFALRSGLTGLLVAGTWTSLLNAQGQQVVRFTPSSLYDNSTVHSLTIAGGSGGVRDRAGRPLTDVGDVGSNFTTSDTVGASVVASLPPLAKPVDPVSAIRFDFSEVVTGTAADLDVSNPNAAAQLFWQANGSSVWQPFPLDSMFLTRSGYSLTIQPLQGVTLTNDSLKRRIHISRLKDLSGNPMVDYDQTYRIWDANAPHVEASFPPGAPTGSLSGGSSYTITPVLSNLDDLASGPGGDIDRLDYFLASASDGTVPASTPVFSGRTRPFAFTFVAAYVGNGTDPRPFPVWVQAVDTSTNKSNTVKLAMQVLPNASPVLSSVSAAATAPVAGTFYAGSALAATVAGAADPDGSAITLTAELRKNNAASPNDPADLVASLPSQALTRPAGGWAALPPPVFTSAIPITTADGTSLFFRVKATDSLGAFVTAESARFAVAHDANAPTFDSFVARVSGSTSPASQFFIGQKIVLEFRARDAETAVRTTSVALSGVFTSPQAATLVGGTTNLYRTAELTVPATVPPGGQSVTATASATDWGGNTGTSVLTFTVSPTPDPYAPVATWLTPWEGGAWPASYTSTVSAQGAALLLRVKVSDLDRVSGLDIPGTIASVQFKGPADAAGTLTATAVDAFLVAGTGGPGSGIYEVLWRVPNGVADGTQLPFQVRVVDAGANATVVDAHLRAVRPRKVYEAAQLAALPADTLMGAVGDPAGPVFLLDGAILSLYPQTAPAVRSLTSMYVYAGGVAAGATFTSSPSVLTAPEVTSYASSVLYNPLELTVTDTFGLGHGARVDVSAKGLLGSTPTQSMLLPGQTGSQQTAGGSHGGSGGPGSPLGWTRTDLFAPGSVYDSVKDPALPGGGGGYATGSFGATAAGATGGGVVRLIAPGAVIHLAGDVVSAGADGNGAFLAGGGAGGAIRIVAGRLEGAGGISAAGGRGTNGNYAGGGGGGRIALSFADPPAAALTLNATAPGGLNNPVPDVNAQQAGGAGTVYLEELDALGAPKAPGKLIVTNASGKPAWPTPFSGAQRFGSVEGHGAARLVFADDLTVGPDPGVVNDRASVSLDAEARLLLKTEGPQIALTAAPDGGNVTTGRQLSISYTLSNPIGLFARVAAFSPSGAVTTVFADEPASVSSGALSLQVPANQPPGSITYSLQVSDRAGRTQAISKSWTVLPDAPPVLALTGVTTGPSVLPGAVIAATANATDDVGLASVVFALSGAVTANDGRGVTGLSSSQTFGYRLPTTLTAGQTVTLQVDVYDTFGHKTSAAPVTWTILADTVAPVITSVALSPVKTGDQYTSGDVITFTVAATDNVGISAIRLTVGGVTTPFVNSPALLTWTAPLVSGATPYSLDVEALDFAGNRSTTSRAFTVSPSGGGTFPTAAFTCPSTGAYLPSAYAGASLTVAASDTGGVTKIEFFRPGDTTPFSTSTPPSGAPTTYSGTSTAITLPTVALDTVVRYRARAWNTSALYTEVFTDVHVAPMVDIASATATDIAVVRTGTVTFDVPKTFAGLVVLRGASVTHSPTTTQGAEKSLNLTVTGPLYVECGGSIDATGKGYPSGMTYPGAAPSTGFGGHLGPGGTNGTSPGDTFGSVARPQEAGANNGGGIVRVQSSGAVVVDGTIASSGGSGGGGGSVWLTTSGLLSGGGSVQARGSGAGSFSGGGGAVALEFGALSGAVVDNSRADTPDGGFNTFTSQNLTGGAGTVLVKGPGSQYGELQIDPRGVYGPRQTVLPSFGSGTAQPGTTGATLVTDRTVDVPAYFAGHWVEVRDSSGVLKGTWRIGTTPGAISAKTVTLVPNGGETISLASGDLWQGLYRFDSMRASLVGFVLFSVTSADPIEVSAATGTTITGSGAANAPFLVRAPLRGANLTIEAAVALGRTVDGGNLTVKAGGLVKPADVLTLQPGLSVNLTGALVVESTAAIDASLSYGYAGATTYPGAVVPGASSGGGHLGVGGVASNPPSGTFGSVTRPLEAGGGGNSLGVGGGTIHVTAPSGITIDGALRVNGNDVSSTGAGAGGSVWLTTSGTLGGTGVIEAKGGNVPSGSGSAGGGGAIALDYASTSGSIVANARASGGTSVTGAGRHGGAGTIWTKGAASTFGDLLVDNRGTAGQPTVLPSLGSGIAQAGSSGATLVTDRASNIPAYFAGHWVEISSATGTLRATCRISTGVGGIVNKTVLLDSCSASPVVAPGDRWQGVYRFDAVVPGNGGVISSVDPIRATSITLGGSTTPGVFTDFGVVAATNVTVTGNANATSITSATLTIKTGAVLSQVLSSATTARGLSINLTGALAIEAGAAIDVTGRGYPVTRSYPGAGFTTGSHIGVSGSSPGAGVTYGSVYQPTENGAGGTSGPSGGGSVRIVAGSVTFGDAVSAIRANGGGSVGLGGAGGSIWITTAGAITGDGVIEAKGGDSVSQWGGGGGAIAIEYGSASGTALPGAAARGGAGAAGLEGGAGTIFLRGPSSTFGDVTIDDAGKAGFTAPPSFGTGVAGPGSSGATLELDRLGWLPPYFVGHWLEIRDASGATLKGTWRVGSITVPASTRDAGGDVEMDTVFGTAYSGFLVSSTQTLGARFGGSAQAGFTNNKFFAARFNAGQWQYDNASTFINFTPDPADRVFATFTTNGTQILSVTPLTCTGTTCGSQNGIPVMQTARGTVIMNVNLAGAGSLRAILALGLIVAEQPQSVTLVPNGAETITVLPTDLFQGVYWFDSLKSTNGARILAGDPIRLGSGATLALNGATAGTQFLEILGIVTGGTTPTSTATVSGRVSLQSLAALDLTVKAGATLTHPFSTSTVPAALTLSVTNALTVEAGASIDASGRGYPINAAYAGATVSGTGAGGSHLGVGGSGTGTGGSTYGSVLRPSEEGGGAGGSFGSAGGGAIRVTAASLQVDGAIRANGDTTSYRTGAGGSLWLTTGILAGAGVIEARGGDTTGVGDGRGGGGAVVVEYSSAGAGILSGLSARGGLGNSASNNGGAGTVVRKGSASTFGDLTVDNQGVATSQATVLPALGSGTAQVGTTGATLVTNRPVNIPAYFAGHWVEISDSSSVLKGACQISTAAGGIVNKTVTLVACSSAFAIGPGDKWQGIYRFDSAPTTTGGATLTSVDPIRIGGSLVRTEPVATALAPFAVRSVSLCTDLAAPLEPGSSFVACADTEARDVDLEISGAFEARVAGYGNCRDSISIPGSAKAGPLKIVATARDDSGQTASATLRALVVADERAPVLVSVEPAPGAAFRSGDPLRVAVEAWDDVGIASVAITLGGTRTFLTAPPFEVRALAPPVASAGSLPVLVEVFDPSGNVSRRALDLGLLPAGARLPLAAPSALEPGVSFENGRLAVDGGWPWRDADGETRGRTLELPAIGTHAVTAVDGANGIIVALDSPVARAAVHGGSVNLLRGGELVGRLRILSVSEDGLVLRLEGRAQGDVRRGDLLEGNWAFESVELTRGAVLRATDVVEAPTMHVDASSVFLSKNLQIPSSAPAPAECPSRGLRPEPPGTAPAAAPGVAP